MTKKALKKAKKLSSAKTLVGSKSLRASGHSPKF